MGGILTIAFRTENNLISVRLSCPFFYSPPSTILYHDIFHHITTPQLRNTGAMPSGVMEHGRHLLQCPSPYFMIYIVVSFDISHTYLFIVSNSHLGNHHYLKHESHPFSRIVILSDAKLSFFLSGLSSPESECGPLSATFFPESLDQTCLIQKMALYPNNYIKSKLC